MKAITRRVFSTLIIGHIFALFGIVIYSIFTADKGILPEFALNWLVSRSLVYWIDFFVPITLSAIALAFSVFLSSGTIRTVLQGERSFVRIAGGSVVVVIVISAAFVGLSAFLYGPSRDSLESMANHSRDAKSYYETALKAGELKDYTTALEFLQRALILAPKYTEALQVRDRYVSMKNNTKTSMTSSTVAMEMKETPSPKEAEITRSFNYEDFIKRAEEYLGTKDWYSALYYINKAADVADKISPELAIMKSRAETGIRGGTPNGSDLKKRELYDLKQKAIIDKLQNNRPLEAYYLLLKAQEMSKDDTDVRKWLPETIRQLQTQAFFSDELQTATRRVSSGSIMFLNRTVGENREYLYAASLVEGPYGYFLLEPELVVIDSNGTIIEDRRAEFGKILDNVVLLKAVDRHSEANFHEATVLAGNIPLAVRNTFKIEPQTDFLWDVGTGHGGYESMPLYRQIAYLPVLSQLGYDPAPLQSVLLMELTKVVSLASLCFLAMGWAWSHRNRYLTQPVPLIILMIALVPAFMILITSAYGVLCGALISSLLLTLGFGASLVAIVLIQGAQLAFSLVYVSGQSID